MAHSGQNMTCKYLLCDVKFSKNKLYRKLVYGKPDNVTRILNSLGHECSDYSFFIACNLTAGIALKERVRFSNYFLKINIMKHKWNVNAIRIYVLLKVRHNCLYQWNNERLTGVKAKKYKSLPTWTRPGRHNYFNYKFRGHYFIMKQIPVCFIVSNGMES